MDIPPFPNDPAPNNSPSRMDSDPSASTPPPTEQDLQHNFIPKPHQPPSFNEFVLQNASSPALASLNPQESVLRTEVQEITAEEFGRSIDAATRSAAQILVLKLPRNCKRKAEELAASLTTSKKTPQLCKRSTRKRSTKPSTVKPVDLLTKGPNTNPTSEGPGQSPAVTDGQLSRLPAGHPSSSTSAHGGPLAANSSATEPVDNPWEPAGNRPSPLLDHAEGSAQKNAAPAQSPGPTQVESDCPDDPVAPSNAADSPQLPKSSGPLSGLADGPPLFHPPLRTSALNPWLHLTTTPPRQTPTPAKTSQPRRLRPVNLGSLQSLSPTLYVRRWLRFTTSLAAPNHPGRSIRKLGPHFPPCSRIVQGLCTQQLQHARHFICAVHPAHMKYGFKQLRRLVSVSPSLFPVLTTDKVPIPAEKFLLPSTGEQWYCPDLIDLPKLTGFGDKSNDLRPGSFIPTVTKTPHPESTIVRGLYRLLHPPQQLHADWARIIAALVEL
ncbi:hypothetical protein PTTG_00705, partial [Puccinia triticina 1-1 BBBD Race 1]